MVDADVNNWTSIDRERLVGPATLLVLILAGFVLVRIARPPKALGPAAPPAEFSAARAMRDVAAIAVEPHPVASAEHDRVRDYLVGRLRELGADPELLTSQAAARPAAGPTIFATVINIVGRIHGSKSTGEVLLVAHYDSVPWGPGAGDDAVSVAAILEALRALRTGPPLRNDVVVLFTDGEELGLLGAAAFAADSTRAKPRVVLNFEMRGDTGDSRMFQTSPRNSWLIDALAAAAPYPRAYSLSEAIYRQFPNDTDLTVFLNAGIAGMNFAAIGGLVRYHTMLDDIRHLNPDTLQHQGSYALAMARQFGGAELSGSRDDASQIYFTVGSHLFHYAQAFAIPIAILIAFIAILACVVEIRARRLSSGSLALGAAVYLGALGIAFGEARLASAIVVSVSGWEMLPSGTTYGGSYFEAASTMIVVATLWALYALLSRRIRLRTLGAGALLIWTPLMLVTAALAPLVSYIFAWPTLFAASSLDADSRRATSVSTRALPVLLVATALMAPLITLGDGTALTVTIAAMAAALMFGLAIPYLDFLGGGVRWIIPTGTAALAVLAFFLGMSHSAFDPNHPHPDSIFYLLDADSAKSSWVSVDYRPDRFTAQFFHDRLHGESLAHLTGLLEADDYTREDEVIARRLNFTLIGNGRAIVGNAPAVALTPPEITLQSDSSDGTERTIKLHLRSTRGAPILWLAVPVGIIVSSGSINAIPATNSASSGWSAGFWNVPPQGIDVELKLVSQDATAISLIDQSWGLPKPAGSWYRPRRAEQMPMPYVDFDSSALVKRTLPISAASTASR
jgi:hypothetical protein